MKNIRAAAGVLLASLAAAAMAQPYPSKPIRLMVPFPPGGSTDIVARIVAQKLGAQLGQSLVIENRGGAGGTLGTAVVAKAPADGYNLVVGTTSTHVVAPSVYQKLEYDPVKDFAPDVCGWGMNPRGGRDRHVPSSGTSGGPGHQEESREVEQARHDQQIVVAGNQRCIFHTTATARPAPR